MNDVRRPAPPRETVLAMLEALGRTPLGMDSGALHRRTNDFLRRRAFGMQRRGDTEARIRRRLQATGAIAKLPDGRWVLTARGTWMLADPDSWMPGDILPVTESEMRALRGYARLNLFAFAITIASLATFLLDGHHLAAAATPWYARPLYVPQQVDALLRMIVIFGGGVIVPLIVLLVSERGSDWVALVTGRYRRAKVLADPAVE